MGLSLLFSLHHSSSQASHKPGQLLCFTSLLSLPPFPAPDTTVTRESGLVLAMPKPKGCSHSRPTTHSPLPESPLSFLSPARPCHRHIVLLACLPCRALGSGGQCSLPQHHPALSGCVASVSWIWGLALHPSPQSREQTGLPRILA